MPGLVSVTRLSNFWCLGNFLEFGGLFKPEVAILSPNCPHFRSKCFIFLVNVFLGKFLKTLGDILLKPSDHSGVGPLF